MSIESKEKFTCTHCGSKEAVTVTEKTTRKTTTLTVSRCKCCNKENTLMAVWKLRNTEENKEQLSA